MGDIRIDSKGGTEVLALAESVGTGGTRGAEDVGVARSRTETDGAVYAGIWGSSVSTVGGN